MTIEAEKTHTCFFYGTLMAFKILSRVIYGTHVPSTFQRERLEICPAVLHDHRRHRVRGMDYPGVTPEKGGSVRGTLVSGLSDMDVARLDFFEGTEYDRRQADVKVIDGEGEGAIETRTVNANVYIWVEGDEYLDDEEWDFVKFCKDRLPCWVGEGTMFVEADGVDFYSGSYFSPNGMRRSNLGVTA